jgi:signal transduction histidine kinase/ligand-binding sensor domain-containing protein
MALDQTRGLSQYIHDEWGPSKGYSGGRVYGFAQSADGYLWIANEKGLTRFDGLSFENIAVPQSTAAGGATVSGVAADGGTIWARLGASSLVSYRDGEFEEAAHGLTTGTVGALTSEAGGDILVASSDLGLARLKNGRFVTVVYPDLLPQTPVVSVAETGRDIWLGTRDAGLFRFDGYRVSRVDARLPDAKINALVPGSNGEMWIGTDRGVTRWSPNGIVNMVPPAPLGEIPVLALLRDRESNIWVAAGARGVVRITGSGMSWFRNWDARARGIATAVFEDREGNIWIGTSRGIERLRDGVFAAYPELPNASSDRTGPVYVDQSDRTWFATTDGGLFWLAGDRARRVDVAGLSSDTVYSLDGHNRDLWVGRQVGGLTHLRVTDAGAAATSYTTKEGLAQDSVFVVHVAHDESVWAGTLSAGVSRLRDGMFQTYTTKDGLASDSVTAIAESNDGTMWFGSPRGVSRLSGNTWRTYTMSDGLPTEEVNALLANGDGEVWVGTSGGLAVLQRGAERWEPGETVHEAVVGLAQDRTGALWCATSDRLLRISRATSINGATATGGNIREYDAADGLVSRESFKRQRTLAVDSKGRVWYASTSGLAVADPSRFARPIPPTILTIQQIAADDLVQRPQGPIAFPSSHRRTSISFVGLSLAVPERVRYRYRLDGFDSAWSVPSSGHTAVYTNLGPGLYLFRVMATDSNGEWSGPEQTLAFQVVPTLWQMTWFRVAMLVLASLAVFTTYRLRLAHVSRRLNRRFEERLTERTRIAQELHDTLLQGFVSAAMHLDVAVSRVPEDSDVRGQLSHVLDMMRRVVDEGRHAIRGLRSPGGAADDLKVALTSVAQDLGIMETTKFRVVVEGRPRSVHAPIRDDLYRIGREALTNAVRHASARLIEVELTYRPDRLTIVIRDDGIGIDEHMAQSGREGHWGLSGMRERAEAIGGRLAVRSRAGAGTEVEISVSGAVAFRTDESRRPRRSTPPGSVDN